MKKFLIALALVGSASAADWYQVPLTQFSKVESKNWGTGLQITLERGFPNWNTPINVEKIRSGSDAITDPVQVLRVALKPPSGEENRWLSLVLAGQAAGRTIWVYADINSGKELIAPAGSDMRLMLE